MVVLRQDSDPQAVFVEWMIFVASWVCGYSRFKDFIGFVGGFRDIWWVCGWFRLFLVGLWVVLVIFVGFMGGVDGVGVDGLSRFRWC